jgi:hypothetical protein
MAGLPKVRISEHAASVSGSFLNWTQFEDGPMNIRYLVALCILFIATPAVSEDVVTYVWDPGCNHTMTTNHFMLAPGQDVKVYIDLSECSDEQIGSMLFFGYNTTKTRSRQLSAKDKVYLSMTGVYETGNFSATEHSASGSLLVDMASMRAKGCHLMVSNMNRKELKIRLRAQLIAP